MKSLIFAFMFVMFGFAHAQTVTPNPVQGIYVPFDIDLPNGGQLRYNGQAIDASKFWIVSGNCVRDYIRPYGPIVYVGATCTGPSRVHLQSTGQLTSTCAYDGAILEPLHLTLRLDGAVFYDEPLYPRTGQVCYVTPAAKAVTTFTYPTLTFDNSQQNRDSALTEYFLDGYLLRNYTLTINGPVTCSPYLRDINPSRWIIQLKETGMKCGGIIPAGSIATVTLQ